MIFEVLGFDILLDHKCRPWLLEVNSSPSFTTDTPLDKKIKKALITDTINLINLSEGMQIFPFLISSTLARKEEYKRQQAENLLMRMRTGKQTKLTPEERNEIKAKNEVEREQFEVKNLGKYIMLYPLSEKIRTKMKADYEKLAQIEDNDFVPDQSILHNDNDTDEGEKNQKNSKKKSSKKTIKENKPKKPAKENDECKRFAFITNFIYSL